VEYALAGLGVSVRQVGELVESGWIGPEVGPKLAVCAPVGEEARNDGVVPPRDSEPGVRCAILGGFPAVDREVEFSAHKLGVVVQPDPGSKGLVLGSNEQREGLG
jgi:hypothetical protein